MNSHHRLFHTILFVASFIPSLLLATFTDNPFQEENVISYDKVTGFTIKNAFERLNLGGYVQVDGRLFLGANQNKSTFLIRRARIFFTGNLYDSFDVMFMARWDKLKPPELEFAWVQTTSPSWAKIRVGLFKVPFSLEASYLNTYLTFAERSLVIHNYHHPLDTGVMVHGTLFDKNLEYGVGFFNGLDKKIDNNNNKELVGRMVFVSFPFLTSKGKLYTGFSFSSGRYDEILSGTVFTTGADTVFWEWTNNSDPVVEHSTRINWGMDFEWFDGPLYIYGEYLYTNWGRINHGDYTGRFWGYGGYVAISYLLTGEDKPRNSLMIPKHNFNGCNQWGAWEIAARYEVFYAPKKLIETGFATGANQAHGPSLALNWYLNPMVEIKLNGQHLWFNRPILIHSHHAHYESVIICRVQGLF
jgi:phosphate-selective porin OprO/OprP